MLNLRGSFFCVLCSYRRASKLMNSVLNTHSSRLSYSSSCRIMKSSCSVLYGRQMSFQDLKYARLFNHSIWDIFYYRLHVLKGFWGFPQTHRLLGHRKKKQMKWGLLKFPCLGHMQRCPASPNKLKSFLMSFLQGVLSLPSNTWFTLLTTPHSKMGICKVVGGWYLVLGPYMLDL